MIISSDLKTLRSENIHKFEIITRLTVEGNIQTFHYKLKISLVHCQEKNSGRKHRLHENTIQDSQEP